MNTRGRAGVVEQTVPPAVAETVTSYRPAPRRTHVRVERFLAMALVALLGWGAWLVWSGTTTPRHYLPAPDVQAPFADPNAAPSGPTRTETMRVGQMGRSRVFVPSLGIYARWVAAGVQDGSMRLPAPDVSVLGRLTGQPLYAGHVSYNGTKGALYPLHRLRPGARFYITDQAGHRRAYAAVLLANRPKAPLDAGQFVTAPTDVVLVTCGGSVRLLTLPDGRRVHTYSDNIVVVGRLLTQEK